MINSPFTLPISERYQSSGFLIYQLTTFRIGYEFTRTAIERNKAELVSLCGFFFILIFSLCVIDGTSFRLYVFGSNRVEMYCSNNFWYFFLFNESDFLHLHLLLWIEWFRMEFVLNEISMVYNTSKLIEKFAIYKCKTGKKATRKVYWLLIVNVLLYLANFK